IGELILGGNSAFTGTINDNVGTIRVTGNNALGAPRSEIQLLTVNLAAFVGTYSLTIAAPNGVTATTPAIFDASSTASDLETNLNLLASVGANSGGVSVADGYTSAGSQRNYYITFNGGILAGQDITTITASCTAVTATEALKGNTLNGVTVASNAALIL